MLLKLIELENHPILGNIKLDFCDNTDNPAMAIILAGENGTGKSTLLNVIYDLANLISLGSPPAWKPGMNEKRTYIVRLLDHEKEMLLSNNPNNHFQDGVSNSELTLTFDYSKNSWDFLQISFLTLENQPKSLTGIVFSDQKYRNLFKSIYSDVEINFIPNAIQSVTTRQIDQQVTSSVRSLGNLATEMVQLLVDIQAQDDSDLSDWVKSNPGIAPPEEEIDVRTKRFKSAYHQLFPRKRYKGVKTQGNSKIVMFEECGTEISINNLSSGEKQIVFRAGFLLKDKQSTNGAVVLIDEPEISLHPSWQLKIMKFFRSLFTSPDGIQTSQIIVVTHSPFIVHGENPIDEKVIVFSKATNGILKIDDQNLFYGWTPEIAIRSAFNIRLNPSSDDLVVFVEGETDEAYLEKALEVFNFRTLDINLSVMWIGRSITSGKSDFTGHTALTQAKAFMLANPGIVSQKILLLYDSDTNKQPEDHKNLHVRRMPHNINNKLYKIGIENLLHIEPDFDKDRFYKTIHKTNDYGGEVTIQELDKTGLCHWICSLDSQYAKRYLEPMKPMLNEIVSLALGRPFDIDSQLQK